MGPDVDLVTLGLGAEIFAVPVGCVIEIVAMRELVRIPDTPHYLAGLTEVRDMAVPVIDLRRRLGLPPAAATHQTRIIVLEAAVHGRKLLVGLIADRVIEVISLSPSQIGPPPDIGASAGASGAPSGVAPGVVPGVVAGAIARAGGSGAIGGIGRDARGFIIIFDMTRLLSGDEVMRVASDVADSALGLHAA